MFHQVSEQINHSIFFSSFKANFGREQGQGQGQARVFVSPRERMQQRPRWSPSLFAHTSKSQDRHANLKQFWLPAILCPRVFQTTPSILLQRAKAKACRKNALAERMPGCVPTDICVWCHNLSRTWVQDWMISFVECGGS